ncbi:MAG: TrkA C-terminal domain-containing protein [Desulfobacterales bacterium]|nr:TrkA C-terminal domain-containing protein [Desulfobacterales bacterium]
MGLLDKIKEGLFQGSEKITDVTDKIVEKGKKVGAEGVEATRDIFTKISERTSDVTALAKLKYELSAFTKQLDGEALNLGRLVLTLRRNGEFSPENETFRKQLQKLEELDGTLKMKQNDYEQLKKKHSDNYVIEKLSEDLSSANAIIDQVIISKQSNVVNKLLKDIVLPKEALVSAVKRGEEVIIPDGNTQLNAGDQVIVIGKTKDVEKVVKRFSAA